MSGQHSDPGYRIECKECGAWALGPVDGDPEMDKEYHRDNHCQDADFEVTQQ